MFFFFTFFVGLIALVFGLGLLMWSYRNEGKCIDVAKVFGYIVTFAALFGLIGTLVCGAMHKKERGYHKMYKMDKAQIELIQPQFTVPKTQHNV